MSEIWENACGKLPSWRLASGRTPRTAGRRRCTAQAAARRSRAPRHGGPCSARLSASQKRAGQEGALARGRPSTLGRRVGSARTNPSVISSRWIASTVPTMRGSLARQEADQRHHQQLRVERVGAVVLDERFARRVEALAADVGVDRVAQRAPLVQRPLQPACCSTALTARSNATQAITLEWVKCRRGPRTSQMPSSGFSQTVSRKSSSTPCTFQASSSARRP